MHLDFFALAVGDFELKSISLWVVLAIDLLLLVMRDADLWDDVGRCLQEYFGKCVSKYLYVIMMVTGGGDEVGDMMVEKTDKTGAFHSSKVPEAIKREVREQTITQCAYTELISTVVLLANTVVESYLDTPIITHGKCKNKRTEIVYSYLIILIFQILALVVSHKIIQFKVVSFQKQHGSSMPNDKRWHCFYSHKKEHAHTEQWVIAVKDVLWEEHHLKGFFDRDNLDEISQRQLDLSISESCSLLVFLARHSIQNGSSPRSNKLSIAVWTCSQL